MAPSQTAVTSLADGKLADLIYAGLQLRIVAFILDIIVLVSFLMLFIAAGGLQTLLRSDFGKADPPDSAFYIWVAFILAFIPFAVLYFVLLWSRWGQTVGMMAVHIKVISRDGGRIPVGRCALRLLGYPASVLPLFAGLAIALFDRERRTLHDHLARTVVVELP